MLAREKLHGFLKTIKIVINVINNSAHFPQLGQ